MKSNTERKVNKSNADDNFKLVDQDVDETGLEYVGVEEEEEDYNDSKHDT